MTRALAAKHATESAAVAPFPLTLEGRKLQVEEEKLVVIKETLALKREGGGAIKVE